MKRLTAWSIASLALLLSSPAFALTVASGSYTGNSTDDTDIVISPACQPVAVFVIRNSAGRDLVARFSSMPSGDSYLITNATTVLTTAIKSFNVDGFRLGTSPSANQSGVTHYYTAICDNGASDISVDTWTGNASDNRDITMSTSFTPELVLVARSDTGVAAWRGATSHSGDSSSAINSPLAASANYLQSFSSGSFQVGTSLNSNTVNFYSLALKASDGVGTGSFAGNTSDDRDITAIANPQFVMIKGNSTTAQSAYRFGGIAGDASFCDQAASITNLIQSLGSTGFQVGTNSCANENGVTMYWFAFTTYTPTATSRTNRRVVELQ